MASYRFAARAEADLVGIARYTKEKWGIAQADKYVGELRIACQLLAENPGLGRAFDRAGPALRRYEINKHVVFYRLLKSDIAIVRILHERMLATKPRLLS